MQNLDDFSRKIENERILEEHKDQVLLLIVEKGVCYPTEIARTVNLQIESVNKILSNLIKLGFVKRVIPNHYNPQSIFRVRIPEFWEIGLDSYDKVNNCNWYTATLAAIDYIKAKYKGKQKQIRGALITYLGFDIPKEP